MILFVCLFVCLFCFLCVRSTVHAHKACTWEVPTAPTPKACANTATKTRCWSASKSKPCFFLFFFVFFFVCVCLHIDLFHNWLGVFVSSAQTNRNTHTQTHNKWQSTPCHAMLYVQAAKIHLVKCFRFHMQCKPILAATMLHRTWNTKTTIAKNKKHNCKSQSQTTIATSQSQITIANHNCKSQSRTTIANRNITNHSHKAQS